MNELKRVLIVTGGDIDVEFTKEYIREKEYTVIAVDGGLWVLHALGVKPEYVVGDFDTISGDILENYLERKDITVIRHNPVKDYTDTSSAVGLAIELCPDSIEILGGIGSRFDHSFANVLLLQRPLAAGVEAVIVNQQNRIRILGNQIKQVALGDKRKYPYFSLLPLSKEVTGITVTGAKYPLEQKTFSMDKEISLGVSNEIEGAYATITIENGLLLVVESAD